MGRVERVEAIVQRRVLRHLARRRLLDEADADGHARLAALARLHALKGGAKGGASLASSESRLLHRFPKPDVQGRTALLLSPLELLERISKFVPPPRVHRHRYHGVLAPNARLRSRVVALGRPDQPAEEAPAGAPAGH